MKIILLKLKFVVYQFHYYYHIFLFIIILPIWCPFTHVDFCPVYLIPLARLKFEQCAAANCRRRASVRVNAANEVQLLSHTVAPSRNGRRPVGRTGSHYKFVFLFFGIFDDNFLFLLPPPTRGFGVRPSAAFSRTSPAGPARPYYCFPYDDGLYNPDCIIRG